MRRRRRGGTARDTARGQASGGRAGRSWAGNPSALPAVPRRSGLTRLAGWAFEGPDYHDRAWFLTRKGEWYRSGAYGNSASDGKRWKSVRFDDVEKRAVIDEMAWQQRVDSGLS